MALIVLTVPDAELPLVLNAYAARNNWQATLPDGSTNPVTKAQNAKNQLILSIRGVTKGYQRTQNIQAAAATPITDPSDIT